MSTILQPSPTQDDGTSRGAMVMEAQRLVHAMGSPHCIFAALSDDELRALVEDLTAKQAGTKVWLLGPAFGYQAMTPAGTVGRPHYTRENAIRDAFAREANPGELFGE